MKNVRVINTATSLPIEVKTDAKTWGELRDELSKMSEFSNLHFNSDELSVFQKDSKGRSTKSLLDELISEEREFKIYLTPKKHKGGIYSTKVLKDLRGKLVTLLDELIGEESKNSHKKSEISGEEIVKADYDKLVDIIDYHNLDIDPSDFDEHDTEEIQDLKDIIAEALDIELPKPRLSAEEQDDIDFLSSL